MKFIVIFLYILWGLIAIALFIERSDQIRNIPILDKIVVMSIFIIAAPILFIASVINLIIDSVLPEDDNDSGGIV